MSQAVITHAFEQWKQQQRAQGKPLVLDGFILANMPASDLPAAISPDAVIPSEGQIVHRADVARAGAVNENAVAYELVLDDSVGDFNFNWIGLVNKDADVLAAAAGVPAQRKVRTSNNQQGNVLTRSVTMEYAGAQADTQISERADLMQIDVDIFARLLGLETNVRLQLLDLYGRGGFLGDGFLVVRNGDNYSILPGTGYVGGLRVELDNARALPVTNLPTYVWVDASQQGSLFGGWNVVTQITVAPSLEDYTDNNGFQHYVFAVAYIDAEGNVTDLRPIGTQGDQTQQGDFLRKENNLSDVNDPQQALANLNGVPTDRRVNGHPLSQDVAVTAQDIFGGQAVEIGIGADLNNYTVPGLYFQSLDSWAETGFNYPEQVAGSLEVLRSAGVTQIYRVASGSRHYIRSLYQQDWTDWARVYDSNDLPGAEELGALPLTGGTLNGRLRINAEGPELTLESPRGYPSFIQSWDPTWDSARWYVGNGGRDAKLVLHNYTCDTTLSLSNIARINKPLEVEGTITPTNYDNFNQRYYPRDEGEAMAGKIAPRNIAGNNWWKCGSTGKMIQSGTGNFVTNIPFPLAFPNRCLSVVAAVASSTVTPENHAVYVYSVTNTGFRLRVKGIVDGPMRFLAFGD
mgnify:CR=1 FL=1